MRRMRRILVAVKDPAAKPSAAVTKAAQLALAFGAELELFHSISTPYYIDGHSFDQTLPAIQRKLRQHFSTELLALRMG